MTQLEMVNKILARLREDEVSTVAENDYAKLIANFVNDAKADMEDINYEWSMYEVLSVVNILDDGTREYAIPETNDRSWLMRAAGHDRVPMAFDVTSGENGPLRDIPLKQLKAERDLTITILDTDPFPRTFAIEADNTTGNGWKITLLWGADNARVWNLYWYVPQDDFLTDGSDDNTVILLPSRPMEMRALWYAQNERGEELGESLSVSRERSQIAISAALELDMQVQKKSDEIDITNRECL